MRRKTPSLRKLQELCLKKNTYVGLDKYTSKLATYFTKLFLYTPLRPMQVMFLWFIMQLIACIVILQGGYANILGGIVLFHFAIVIDHCDGQMARYLKEESILALYMDQLYHNIANPIFVMVLSIAVGLPLLGLAIVLVYLMNRVILFNPHIYNLKNERMETAIQQSIVQDQAKLCYSRMKAHEKSFVSHVYEWFRIEHPLSVIFWGALLGLVQWTLGLYLVLFLVDFFRRLRAQLKGLGKADKILRTLK